MDKAIGWPLVWNRIRRDKWSNTFGCFRDRHSGVHWGWDFEAAVGTPIYAIADGEVSLVYGANSDTTGFGLTIEIQFEIRNKTYFAAYCHLREALVRKHHSVTKGQLIGYTGRSGNACDLPASEDHLHFELRSRSKPSPGGPPHRIDPKEIFGSVPIDHAIVDTTGE